MWEVNKAKSSQTHQRQGALGTRQIILPEENECGQPLGLSAHTCAVIPHLYLGLKCLDKGISLLLSHCNSCRELAQSGWKSNTGPNLHLGLCTIFPQLTRHTSARCIAVAKRLFHVGRKQMLSHCPGVGSTGLQAAGVVHAG